MTPAANCRSFATVAPLPPSKLQFYIFFMTIYSIYELLKYNRPSTEKIVTIAGPGIKKPANYKVKIGTNFSEIILKTEGYITTGEKIIIKTYSLHFIKNYIAKSLLAGTGVSENDAARLTLEAIETLGELATGANRPELVTLLRRVIQAGVAAVKAAEHTVSLSVAAWASVEARKDLRPTTRRDLRHFVRRILRVEGAADMPLRSMSSADCKRILAAAFGASPSSYRKGRVILSSVFSYGIRQEWADSNPVTRIEVPAVQEKPIEPLTPEEVEKLQATASRPEFRDMRLKP